MPATTQQATLSPLRRTSRISEMSQCRLPADHLREFSKNSHAKNDVRCCDHACPFPHRQVRVCIAWLVECRRCGHRTEFMPSAPCANVALRSACVARKTCDKDSRVSDATFYVHTLNARAKSSPTRAVVHVHRCDAHSTRSVRGRREF